MVSQVREIRVRQVREIVEIMVSQVREIRVRQVREIVEIMVIMQKLEE